jgi:L-gulonate 3-dehydrogenase
MASSEASVVVIVSSGLVECSWAMLFASEGFQVKLYDIGQQQITSTLDRSD